MDAPLRIDVITIFPGMLKGFLEESILKRAAQKGLVVLNAVDLREFTTDRHQTTDDRPFGGGAGMVMKPEPLFKAVESVRTPEASVILMTPQGRKFEQDCAVGLSKARHLIFICGHYEGVERIFPVHSPNIASLEVESSGQNRRAKLYFLRDRVGKGAKLHAKNKADVV